MKTRRPRRPAKQIAALPTVVQTGKAIQYDAITRDFAMHLDGELVGFARSYSEAETTLDELIHERLTRAYGDAA